MDAHKNFGSDAVSIKFINQQWRKGVFLVCAIFCLTPFAGPATALLLGLLVAQLAGHPFPELGHKVTQTLLQASVVGLGFGMNLQSALAAGRQGISFTVISISGTLLLGYFLGRWLKVDGKTSFLISSGTAICGGSAIAAVSPVIKAEEKPVSVALGCVFIFNSVALLVFPLIGHYLGLSQTQFGLWCAIAIHDTSSVIGAAGKFGNHALQIATTVKLARALWIVPVTFIASLVFNSGGRKIKLPWFIGVFIIAVIANTYFPVIAPARPFLIATAKSGLTLSLFLIGAGLSRTALASVGVKPLLQALLLWIAISGAALFAVLRLA
jgi:uncharacterized integral membrane protein (TIGR00698 family)